MIDWQPSASLDALRLRARLNAELRAFFAERDVLEVETPILSQAGNSDPNMASFSLRFSGRTDGRSPTRWLRTSPEYPLKRLLASGLGDCYELGRVFRDGECGRRHNPEFTMLEWYRVGWNHLRLADEVVELVRNALTLVERTVHTETTTYRDLFRARLGIDPMLDDDSALRAGLGAIEIDPDGLQRDDWLDLLMTHRIQPTLDPDLLLVVHDYPESQCALARVRGPVVAGNDHDPPVAERFEVYLGPLELANGYHELADATEQARRFERDRTARATRGLISPAVDIRLLAALERGLPDCAGVALGVDRLLAAMHGAEALEGVIAFGFARA